MYKFFFRLVFKRMDPEKAHYTAFPLDLPRRPASLFCVPSSPPLSPPATRSCAPRPSACGYARALRAGPPASTRTRSGSTAWRCSGSTHVEIGTVTGEAQPGNPQASGSSGSSRTGR